MRPGTSSAVPSMLGTLVSLPALASGSCVTLKHSSVSDLALEKANTRPKLQALASESRGSRKG